MKKSVLIFSVFVTSWLFANWKQEFFKGFSSKNSWERYEAVKNLDPNDPAQLKQLFWVLKQNDWYVREAAWKRIAEVDSEKSVAMLKKELRGKSTSRYRIREGILLALAIKKERSFLPLIIQKLKDPAWPVRRAAAKALAEMPDKRSITPLLQCWKRNKKKLRVWVHIRIALEKITKRYLGNDLRNWERWWSANQHTFEIGSQDEEQAKKAEETGAKAKRIRTTLKGVQLDFSTRGRGKPLFVLPDYGYDKDYLVPYLAPLEDVVQIFYIKLPPIRSFQNVKRQMGIIVYPVDQLVDAFDELRKKYKKEKIAILGHGISAWVAMRYVTRHPKRVSHLIIVSGFSGQNAYRRGVERLEKVGKQTGDLELEHFAQSLIILPTGKPKYQASSMEEAKALARKEWTIRFADQGDAIIGELFRRSFSPDTGAIVPPFELSKEPRYRIPTLVISGKYALFTSAADSQAIAKHYGGRCYIFPRSRRMPFIEENRTFVRLLRSFFRRK